jgi:antitoxin component of MazEF toxin-antitoxin module
MKRQKGIKGPSQFSADRRVMKLGGSLVVGIPREVVEQWNLERGDEMGVIVEEGVIKIVPKQPTKVESISEEMIEAYSRTMKGIQARVTLDAENSAIHLEFSGENKQAIDLFLRNLWRNLPLLLRLLGLGSVEELSGGEGKGSDREETR